MWIHDIFQTITGGYGVDIAILIIALGVFLTLVNHYWKKMSDNLEAVTKDIVELRKEIKINYDTLHDHTEKTALQTASKFWKDCQEMRCPKTDLLIQKFDEQNRCLHNFVEDGKQARKRTQETLDDMKQLITSLVSDWGHAILRWHRGRDDQ